MPARLIESVRVSSDRTRSVGHDVAIDLADGDLADGRSGGQVVDVVGFVAHAKARTAVLRAARAARTRCFDGTTLVDRLVAEASSSSYERWWRDRTTDLAGCRQTRSRAFLEADKRLLGKSAANPNADEFESRKNFPTLGGSSGCGKVRSCLRRAMRAQGQRLPCGPLAQLAEQQTLNLRVVGSIPRRLTSFLGKSSNHNHSLVRWG